MQFIPLSEKKYPFEQGMSSENSKRVTLPKLMTNPTLMTPSKVKSKVPSVGFIKTIAPEIPINPIYKPSATEQPAMGRPKQVTGKTKGSRSQSPKSKTSKKPTKLEELVQMKGKADSTVSELLSLDMRLKRLKQKVKEKIVESSLGDNFGIFEEFFQNVSFKPVPQSMKNKNKTKSSTSLKVKSSPVSSPSSVSLMKKPNKIITSTCTTCGQPFKLTTKVERKHKSKPRDVNTPMKKKNSKAVKTVKPVKAVKPLKSTKKVVETK